VHVVRKIRVETYLHPDVDAQLEQLDENKSAFIRKAVNNELERNNE